MDTHRETPDVLETVYTDDDILRSLNASCPPSENIERPTYSNAVMRAFRRAKRASEKNNARSRRIVEEMRMKREHNCGDDTAPPHRTQKQTTLEIFNSEDGR